MIEDTVVKCKILKMTVQSLEAYRVGYKFVEKRRRSENNK
jgi:hypothetical protein